jgi:cytochrome c
MTIRILALLLFAAFAMPHVLAADDAAAEALMKKSGCFKCHSIDKKKDAPNYKEIAAKWKGKPDAEAKLATHLTTNPKVKVDGKEEAHDNLKTKSDADVKNAVQFILTR